MASIFDLEDRVRRLRQTFSYFKNAAILTAAEVQNSTADVATQEWVALINEIQECLLQAELCLHTIRPNKMESVVSDALCTDNSGNNYGFECRLTLH
jgi:hypothetical protein